MKKIITILMALLLCVCATGCSALDYIFGADEKPDVQILPTIYERKIIAEAKIEEDFAGYYKATLNGMVKFDFYPNNITLLCNGYATSVVPESVVYANVISNEGTYSNWYVATFNYAQFNFERLSVGTFPLTMYAENNKGTLYLVQTTLTITSPKNLTGNVIYDEETTAEFKLFNDVGLTNGIYYDVSGIGTDEYVSIFGQPVSIAQVLTTHEEGEQVALQSASCFGYIFKGWKNLYTGQTYCVDDETCELIFPGGGFILTALWEIDPNVAVGPEIEL